MVSKLKSEIMTEIDRRTVLDRDRSDMGYETVAALNAGLLNKVRFTCGNNDSINGQPHQITRRLLRIGTIAKLGDEDLLDNVLIDEMFGQNS